MSKMTDALKEKPKRRRSGTAAWHMSKQAVTLAGPEVVKWSDRECLDFLVQVRFGSMKTVCCPHCGSIGEHYWRVAEKRWKCKGCGSTFSITSGTVFAYRKKSLQDILYSVLMWVNSAGGQPALELKRNVKFTYNTCFVFQHKIREALVRGHNVGLLNGDVEMDGAHQSGRRASEKRGKPQGARPVDKSTDAEELKAHMLTQKGRAAARKAGKKNKTGLFDPEFGTALPPDRRILVGVRKRSGVKGKGATSTRVAIGLVESASVVEAVAKDFIAPSESQLNTDTSPAYTTLGRKFGRHRTVEHSKTFSGPNGESNNQAEELNARFDRAEKGIYLNIEPKYLLDYAVETAFRSDTRRMPNGEQLKLAMNLALNVGESIFWKGFTKGRHRHVELTHPLPQLAASSGPPKGQHPISSANGRPPR